MSDAITIHSRLTRVRKGFTEQCEWRNTLGNNEPLHCFSNACGSLDATEYIPAGSSRGYQIEGKVYTESKMSMRY